MDRQNYPYYNNNSLKDMNQSGQGGSNKQGGKKSNYKYANKNNQNNMDDKVNMNSGEHNQNYPHYRKIFKIKIPHSKRKITIKKEEITIMNFNTKIIMHQKLANHQKMII